ncbi:MAG: cell division protein FtsL [Lachnospiraceae bacterium]|nr:cell division protein FtsL [Candidatus Colinaster equi]
MNNRQGRQLNRTASQADYIVYGNTVRKPAERRSDRQIRTVREVNRRNRDKARYMNLGYVLFLSVAVMVTALTLLGYVEAKNELTVSIKNVAKLESRLHSLTLTNDENLDRINEAVNVEELKKIAVEELGMTYAKEGQVVIIDDEGSDYVRQLQQLP